MSRFITFMGDDLINALGWTFVHTLWQGCVIVLLMIFVLQQIPVKKATLRYTVATASMMSMLVAAIATFALLYFEPGKSEIVTSNTAMQVVGAESTGGFSFVAWLGGNLSAMVAIWIAGVILLGFRLLFGLAYIQYLRQTASDLSFKLGGRLEAIARKINYKRALDVAESALVQIPVVVGHLKPLILFPVGAINQLTTEEVEAVLAHEIAHLVRNDFVQNLIQSVIEIVFYYHPAVWWISAVVRSERENCCDDLAIQVCGSSLTYARALVRLQEVGHTAPALALPFLGSKNHLLDRVKRILNEPQNKTNLMEKITATSLLLLCLIFASFSDGKSETESPRETIDVPAMLVSNHYLHYDNTFMIDTIIPRSRTTIVRGDSDGKEVRLEYQNGEIKGLYINGEEVPESRYDEYAEEITVLQNSMSIVPAPPSPPVMPAMPAMPVMPVMPAMPPAPDLQGMIFEFKLDSVPAPFSYSYEPTITRTESTIIREYDDNGNVSYRIEGDHADDTTIEIDQDAGIAYIDDKEIVIDADEITVIEEIETTPAMVYSFSPRTEGEWSSKDFQNEWREKINSEFNEKWNSKEIKRQWKENWDQKKWIKLWKENWDKDGWKAYREENKDDWGDASKEWKVIMEDSENGGMKMKLYEDALEGYNYKIIELNKELEGQEGALKIYLEALENSEGENLHTGKEDLDRALELVRKEQFKGDMSEEEISKWKKEYKEAYDAANKDRKLRYRELKAREKKTRELKEKREFKKDQSSVGESGEAQFYTFSGTNDSNDMLVVTIAPNAENNMSLVADRIDFDSENNVVTLAGNATFYTGETVVVESGQIEYLGSADGAESLVGYSILVTDANPDLNENRGADGEDVEYEIKVVKAIGSAHDSKAKIRTQKRP
jgi:beta-lactamase regulating signal transducer with metallopeptidase domain